MTIQPVKARMKIFDQEVFQEVKANAPEVTFHLNLDQKGTTQLDAWFVDASGEERGAYYVLVERM